MSVYYKFGHIRFGLKTYTMQTILSTYNFNTEVEMGKLEMFNDQNYL